MTDRDEVYVRCNLTGEPARIFRLLRDQGVYRTKREAFTAGLYALHDAYLGREAAERRRAP